MILGLEKKAFHLSIVHSYDETQLDHNGSEIHALDTSNILHMSNSLMESDKRRVESSFHHGTM